MKYDVIYIGTILHYDSVLAGLDCAHTPSAQRLLGARRADALAGVAVSV